MPDRCRCGHGAKVHIMEGSRAADACSECNCRRFRECPHDKVELQLSLLGPDEIVCAVCGVTIEAEPSRSR